MICVVGPKAYVHARNDEKLPLFYKEITILELLNLRAPLIPKKNSLLVKISFCNYFS